MGSIFAQLFFSALLLLVPRLTKLTPEVAAVVADLYRSPTGEASGQ